MQRHTPVTFAPAAVALAAALSVSAAAQPPPAAPLARPPAPACFWIRNVNNFAAVDTSTLFVRVGVGQVWRLTMFGNCFNLDWVHGLGLRNRGAGGSVCEGRTPGLEVIVRDRALGRQRCPVTDVRRLSPAEVAALPRGARP